MRARPPRLVVITDWALPDLVERVRVVADALGPEVAVQHRAPGMPIRAYLARARDLSAVCNRSGSSLFVSGLLDVALLCGAHLHLPGNAPSPADCRPHLPAERWVSVALHADSLSSRAAGADFALVSPVFAPGSKPGDTRPQLGVEGFAEVAARLPCPAYALGGVGVGTAPALASAAGLAALTGVLGADDPAAAARTLLRALR